jgi:hypothetical protein
MTKPKPKLTREALHESLQPPNNCRVKAFRDTLDADSRAVLDEALGFNKADYPSSQLIELLTNAGFDPTIIPGNDAINDHRAGRRPCRCRG